MKRVLIVLMILLLALSGAVHAKQTLFVMIPHTEGEKEYTWFSQGLEQFAKQHPDVEIRFEHMVGSALPQRLATYLVAGDVPDVVMMMQRDLGSMITADHVLDLNQYLSKDPDIRTRDYVASFMEYWSRDGKQLAMPLNPDTGFIYYNVDMFEGAGLPLLSEAFPNGKWTWNDFRTIAQRLVRDNNGDGIPEVYGYEASRGWEPAWGSWVYSNGGYIYDRVTKQSGLDEPEAYEALQWLFDLKNDKIMGPNSPTAQGFGNRAMASLATGWSQYSKDSGMRISSFPHPGASATKPAVHVILGPGLLIFKESKNPDLAWELIKHMVSHESLVSMAELTGRLPSRLSTFATWQKQYEQKMSGSDYVLMAVQSGRGMPYNDRWTDMNNLIKAGMNTLWTGAQPAKAIFENVARQIEALVK